MKVYWHRLLHTNKKIAVVFLLFLFLLVIQHCFVYFYNDDFGYASLSYGYKGNANGMNYTLNDIWDFLKWHYNEWGGRILYIFALIISQHIGLGFIRVLQAGIICVITVCSYLLIKTKDERKNVFISVMLIALYGTIGIPTFKHGIYWFCASTAYVWPLLPFFAALLFYREVGRSRKKYMIPAMLCFFLAAFSQEQIAVMTSAYIVLMTLVRKCNKESYVSGSVWMILSAFLGSAFVILAPGNFKRAGNPGNAEFNALSLGGKVYRNLRELLRINVGRCNVVKVLALVLVLVCVVFILHKGEKRLPDRKGVLKIAGIFVSSLGLMVSWSGLLANIVTCALQLIFVGLMCAILTEFMLRNKYIWMLVLFYSGVCSQLVMLVLPNIPDRCHIMLDFVLAVVMVQILTDYLPFSNFKLKWYPAVLIMFLAFCNMLVLTWGYFINVPAHDLNHSILTAASEDNSAGQKIESIELCKLKDDYFATIMPYQHPEMEPSIKNYYSLPDTVTFVWKEFDE